MNQEIKSKLEQAAMSAWEQDQKANPSPVNPHAYVYGFKAGAQTILENPIEWGLWKQYDVVKHVNEVANEAGKVGRELAERELQSQRYQKYHKELNAALERVKELEAENDRYRKALEDVIIRLEEDKRLNALSIAKEALKQEEQ